MTVNVLADVVERCFGRLRNNIDIVCVDDLVVPLERSKNSTTVDVRSIVRIGVAHTKDNNSYVDRAEHA
jgi:hypothetical protein